jgi:hypothetical protein
MQYIKGKTSGKLMEFKHIEKQYWGRHLGARGYFVASSGNVADEVIAECIRGQDGTEPRAILLTRLPAVSGRHVPPEARFAIPGECQWTLC